MAELKFVSDSKNETYAQSRLEEEQKTNCEGFFDQVTLEEALRLYSTVRDLKPANTLEIGFCTGASGLAILKALEDNGLGTHYAALTNREYAPHSSTRVPRSNLQSELIGMLRELCRQVPDADGIFAQEFLKPVRKDGLENLILLKKIGEDNRDWKTFRSFWDPGDVRTFGS